MTHHHTEVWLPTGQGSSVVYRCDHCAALLKPHALDLLHHLKAAHGIVPPRVVERWLA